MTIAERIRRNEIRRELASGVRKKRDVEENFQHHNGQKEQGKIRTGRNFIRDMKWGI